MNCPNCITAKVLEIGLSLGPNTVVLTKRALFNEVPSVDKRTSSTPAQFVPGGLQHAISLTCNFLGLRVDAFELSHFEEGRTSFGVDFIGNEFILKLLQTIDVRVTRVQAAHQLRFRWNSSLLHLHILQTRSRGQLLFVTQQEMTQLRKIFRIQNYSPKQRPPPKRLRAGQTTSLEKVVPLSEPQSHFYRGVRVYFE